MADNNTNLGLNISLPQSIDRIIQNVLGPTSVTLGQDFNSLYINGRNKILNKSIKKIDDATDKRVANLRVARDVFFNGAFSDSEITAEYFAGVLASSRTEDGQDDSGIFFLDVIKSLSSKQLQLHYIIYRVFNQICISNSNFKKLNLHQGTELSQIKIYIPIVEILDILNIEVSEFGTSIFGLKSKELIDDFFRSEDIFISEENYIPTLIISPTLLGIQLFAIAYNKSFKKILSEDFGCWDNQEFIINFSDHKNELLKKLNVTEYKKED